MADISDVLDAFAAVISGVVYPTGTSNPSVIDKDVHVVPGWPSGNRLDGILDAGNSAITVFAPPNLEREHTRAMSQWLTVDEPTHKVAVSVEANRIVITATGEGSGLSGQNIGVIVAGKSYAYATQDYDTPTTIATGIANALASAGVPASSADNVVTVTETSAVSARVGGLGRLVKEMDRTDRCVTVTIWSSNPLDRTTLGKVIRRRLTDPRFITLVDGSGAWVRYDRTEDNDNSERAGLYRRDIQYWVEFGQYDEEVGVEIVNIETATKRVIPDLGIEYPPTSSNI